jgi:hypothetical protein
MHYEAHDLARFMGTMQPLASKCTTPAAVRARVRMDQMHPDDFTARGGALWTWEGVMRELAAERTLQHKALRLGIKDGNTSILLQRRANREPEQLRLEAVA